MAKRKTSDRGPRSSQSEKSGPDDRGAGPADEAAAMELLTELAELPDVVRRLVGRYAGLADDLTHGAEAIADALAELGGGELEELRRALIQLEGCVGRVDRILHDLLAFAGEMKGLAWAAEAMERAREAARHDGDPGAGR